MYDEILPATVAAAASDELIAHSSTGTYAIPAVEWEVDSSGSAVSPAVGAQIEVAVLRRSTEDAVGIGSIRRSAWAHAWAAVEDAQERGEPIAATLVADDPTACQIGPHLVGRIALEPGSVPTRHAEDITVRVDYADRASNVLWVRRGAAPRPSLADCAEDDLVRSVVVDIESLVVQVTDGRGRGAISKSQLSSAEAQHLCVGALIDATVMSIAESGEVRLKPVRHSGPAFAAFAAAHERGDRVDGTVSNVTPFGAFVALDGLDGLIHYTETLAGTRESLATDFTRGQPVTCTVLEIDHDLGRVSLTMRTTDADG